MRVVHDCGQTRWFSLSLSLSLSLRRTLYAAPLARKRPFHWILMKSRLVRDARETLNFKTVHIQLKVVAVTWLKYCWYGVKLYPISLSLSLFLSFSLFLSVYSLKKEIKPINVNILVEDDVNIYMDFNYENLFQEPLAKFHLGRFIQLEFASLILLS